MEDQKRVSNACLHIELHGLFIMEISLINYRFYITAIILPVSALTIFGLEHNQKI